MAKTEELTTEYDIAIKQKEGGQALSTVAKLLPGHSASHMRAWFCGPCLPLPIQLIAGAHPDEDD